MTVTRKHDKNEKLVTLVPAPVRECEEDDIHSFVKRSGTEEFEVTDMPSRPLE